MVECAFDRAGAGVPGALPTAVPGETLGSVAVRERRHDRLRTGGSRLPCNAATRQGDDRRGRLVDWVRSAARGVVDLARFEVAGRSPVPGRRSGAASLTTAHSGPDRARRVGHFAYEVPPRGRWHRRPTSCSRDERCGLGPGLSIGLRPLVVQPNMHRGSARSRPRPRSRTRGVSGHPVCECVLHALVIVAEGIARLGGTGTLEREWGRVYGRRTRSSCASGWRLPVVGVRRSRRQRERPDALHNSRVLRPAGGARSAGHRSHRPMATQAPFPSAPLSD